MMGDVGRGPLTLWGHGGGIVVAKTYPAQSGAKPFEACEARKKTHFVVGWNGTCHFEGDNTEENRFTNNNCCGVFARGCTTTRQFIL